jgi:hypothetical protein
LTPHQRYCFLAWLQNPGAEAPPAFQQLYLATLEVQLLEKPATAKRAQQELQQLQAAPAWQGHEGFARTQLLGYWLAQDGPGLADWLTTSPIPATLINTIIGCQSLLHEDLRASQVMLLNERWNLARPALSPAVLTLRLNSLTTHLGAEPLAYALAQVGEAARQPQTWRCAHRDLRLALPQPNLRPLLEPLLAEIVTATDVQTAEESTLAPDSESDEPSMGDLSWHLIVEFGHSRSEFFEFALELAQRMESYAQLTDENRSLVHRVLFKRNDLRRFWRLWDYVQSWASTRVYCNGELLEKWKVFPYSQYIR